MELRCNHRGPMGKAGAESTLSTRRDLTATLLEMSPLQGQHALSLLLFAKSLFGLLTINLLSNWGCLDQRLAQGFGSQGTDPTFLK